MAKDYGGMYMDIFVNMYNKNHKKISSLEDAGLKELEDWGKMVEQGRSSMSEKKKKKYKEETPEEKMARSELYKKVCNKPETRRKMSDGRKMYIESLSPAEYAEYCKMRQSYYEREDVKNSMSAGQKRYHQNMTFEEKIAFQQMCQKSATIKAPRFQKRRSLYLSKLENREFTGTWNEFQGWCRLENEKAFEKDFEKVKDQKISRSAFYKEWKNKAPY